MHRKSGTRGVTSHYLGRPDSPPSCDYRRSACTAPSHFADVRLSRSDDELCQLIAGFRQDPCRAQPEAGRKTGGRSGCRASQRGFADATG